MHKSAFVFSRSSFPFFVRFLPPPFFLSALAGTVALFYIISAILGGVYSFSPVPFWDMWDGYLDFYLRLNSSDWSVLWAQSNEHRIILSKILFWLDFKLFNGGVIFLIVCNFLLALLAAVVFFIALKASVNEKGFTHAHFILAAAVTALLFSWVQSNNFCWGFQSQFFLAQSLPLIALYLLFQGSISAPGKNFAYTLAVVVGIACAGTMANGVLALPCMALVAFVSNFPRRRILILASVALVVAILYFYDYQRPAQNGSPWLAITDQTRAMFLFTLAYLGSPFFYVANGSLLAAQLAGAVFVLVLLFFALRILLTRKRNILLLCLLGYEIYLIATSWITASARVVFGIEYAVASRYTTPALMAWCALFILLANYYQNRSKIIYSVAVVALVFALLLLPRQVQALHRYNDSFERLIAALALEMGVKDDSQISAAYFDPQNGLRLADEARHLNISIFANPLLVGTREKIGTRSEQESLPPCLGYIDNVELIPTAPKYLRISGWIYRRDIKSVPRKLMIVDEGGNVVGAALSGQERFDVAKSVSVKAKFAGFKGYMLSPVNAGHLALKGSSPSCERILPSPKVTSKAD